MGRLAAAALALFAATGGAAADDDRFAAVSLADLDRCIGLLQKGAAKEGRACLDLLTGICARDVPAAAPAADRALCLTDEAAAWRRVLDAHAADVEAGGDAMLTRRYRLFHAQSMARVDEVCAGKPDAEREACRVRGLTSAAVNLRFDHLGMKAEAAKKTGE